MGLPRSSRIKAQVQYASERKGVPGAAEIRRCCEAALADHVVDGELVVRIVGESESAQLNQEFRGKSGPTNVLSFPFEAPPGVPSKLLGDLIICAPVVRKEAREQEKPLRAHWAHMIVHGCLHLLGYDHQTDEQAHEMETLEVKILARLGIDDPYAEHSDAPGSSADSLGCNES